MFLLYTSIGVLSCQILKISHENPFRFFYIRRAEMQIVSVISALKQTPCAAVEATACRRSRSVLSPSFWVTQIEGNFPGLSTAPPPGP